MPSAIEGLGTTLVIGSASLCYVTLQGLGIDGGEKLDASCLDNSELKTFLPQTLKEIPDLSFTARFKPEDWALIFDEVNVNQLLTLDFNYQGTPLGSIAFWGYLRSFIPDEGAIGVPWNATGSIVVTNMNASKEETGPVFTP